MADAGQAHRSGGLVAWQIQVVWLKHVEANPKPLGEFPAHARASQDDMTAILNIARHHYPNLRADRLHPNEAGTQKITALLLDSFKTDPGASRSFLNHQAK